MKVSELIEKLKAMPQDLEVYSVCEFGYVPDVSKFPSVELCEDWMDEYEGDSGDQFVIL